MYRHPSPTHLTSTTIPMTVPLLWVFGGLLAGTAVNQIFKPRLPAYRLDVRPWNDPWKAVASHVWTDHKISSALPATVSFFNDNYLNLDVHALWFDLFYMDWDGKLQQIGDLRDRYQVLPSSSANATNTPLWSIPGRSEFAIKDTLYIGSLWSSTVGMLTNSRFYWSLWKGGGRLTMPTTGVAHLRANGQAKLTVAFVCDNVMDMWSLTVQGVDCQMRELAVGWVNLKHITSELRKYALEQLVALPSGHVVAKVEQLPSREDSCSVSTTWWMGEDKNGNEMC